MPLLLSERKGDTERLVNLRSVTELVNRANSLEPVLPGCEAHVLNTLFPHYDGYSKHGVLTMRCHPRPFYPSAVGFRLAGEEMETL